MSRHHVKAKASTKHPKIRKQLEPLLPLPCLDCGHPVTRDQKWQVGHRLAVALGGATTLANAGPSHAWCPTCKKRCNQVAGGRLGARITNSKRQKAKDIRPW